MKANLVYKCQRCGDQIVQGEIASADEFSAADMTILHECSFITSADDSIILTKVGLAKLVGYDENL